MKEESTIKYPSRVNIKDYGKKLRTLTKNAIRVIAAMLSQTNKIFLRKREIAEASNIKPPNLGHPLKVLINAGFIEIDESKNVILNTQNLVMGILSAIQQLFSELEEIKQQLQELKKQ